MAATWPEPTQGVYKTLNFQFTEGRSPTQLRIAYRTLGTLKTNSNGKTTNAVLILHGTTGTGANFFRNVFAGELFNPGQLLSAEDYFLILPDGIGHGNSSKPSDGPRAKFPRYGYNDMVRAQHALLTEHLGVNHLRLVMGTSMGGMHTWVWGTMYPDFMDALMPLASLPVQISGRNRMIRKMAIDSIRTDPEFMDGNYKTQPRGLKAALHVLAWMTSCPLRWQKLAPTRELADELIDAMMELWMEEKDANDFAYAYDASWDYDPRPGLSKIRAPLMAVNSADDQVNPPELEILEAEIKKVAKGKAIVLPISDLTEGHGSHSVAMLWKEYLAELLERSR